MNRFALTLLLLLGLVMTLGAPLAGAQDAELPDLAPREVEITGDLTISFPTLRRQPIVGFNPPPRVPDIPMSRRPFTEAYAQRSVDLPPSPLQAPEPPQVSAIERRDAMTGLIEARLGAYLDRGLSADVCLIESESTSAQLMFDYFGTDGQDLVVSGTEMTTGRDQVQGGLRFEQRAGPVVLELDGSGHRASYGLFGAVPAPGSPALADADRKVSGFEGGIGLRNRAGSRTRFGVSLRSGLTRMESGLYDPAIRIDPATEREAGFLTLRSSAAIPIRDGEIRFSAEGSTMGLDDSGFPGSTVRSGVARSEVSWRYSRSLNLVGGAAVLGYDSASQTGADPARSTTWLAPIAGFEYTLSESMTLEGMVRPELEDGMLDRVLASSPVIMDEPILLPSVATMDARLGLNMQTEMATASVSGGWRDQPFRRYAFQPTASNRGYASGYPALGYGSSDVFFASVDLSVVPFRSLQIGVDAVWQQARLASTEDAVPYVSPLVFGGFAALGLLNGDLEARLEWIHESSRPADLEGTRTIGSLTSVQAMVSWFFHSNYGITTGIRDLGGDPEYWQRYTYESNVFYLGFRYRW
ncbi:MAG: hypothetical protein O3C45_05650 [Bacteroidetes bacterium]|nr:hypothetical protein [Bacteroidota bacterium]